LSTEGHQRCPISLAYHDKPECAPISLSAWIIITILSLIILGLMLCEDKRNAAQAAATTAYGKFKGSAVQTVLTHGVSLAWNRTAADAGLDS
jgi:hypothetical protein